MKTLLFMVGGIVVFLFLAGSGFVLLKKHIYTKTGCRGFKIDHIELRTGIDVPAVASSDCECGEGFKKSTFVIDTVLVKLPQYIANNRFEPGNRGFSKKGSDEHTQWTSHLNTQTAELSFELFYK